MANEIIGLLWDINEAIKRYAFDLLPIFAAFMSPIVAVSYAIFAFVAVDFITGILKARKLGKGDYDAISSRKMSHSVAKIIFYMSGILLAHLTNITLELEMPAIKMVMGLIIAIELRSVDENMKVVLGYSIFGKILDRVKRPE